MDKDKLVVVANLGKVLEDRGLALDKVIGIRVDSFHPEVFIHMQETDDVLKLSGWHSVSFDYMDDDEYYAKLVCRDRGYEFFTLVSQEDAWKVKAYEKRN